MNPWLRSADSSAVTEHLATYHYFDRRLGLPGEYFVAGAEIAIVTVLGSCVSACVRDREQCVGRAVMESLSESSVGARNATFVIDYLNNQRIPTN